MSFIKQGDTQPINIIEFEDTIIDEETKNKLANLKNEIDSKNADQHNQDNNVQ